MIRRAYRLVRFLSKLGVVESLIAAALAALTWVAIVGQAAGWW